MCVYVAPFSYHSAFKIQPFNFESVMCAFLLQNTIPLYGYPKICLSIHQLEDTCSLLILGLLQIKLL